MTPSLVSLLSIMHRVMNYYNIFFLDEDDWNDVIIACSSLVTKWQQLSGFLGLPFKTIRTIKESNSNDSDTSWNEALMQWILQDYNTKKHGFPSWRTLLKAIGRVDQPLFEKLAKENHSMLSHDKNT